MKLTMRAAAKKVTLITTAFVLAVSTLTASVPFILSQNVNAVTTVTVNPGNNQGWVGVDDNGQGGGLSFVHGPATAPLGSGSAQLSVSNNAQGYLLAKSAYAGLKLDDITTLSYDAYIQQGNNTIVPSLQFNVVANADTDTSWQGRLVYEPYQSETVTDGVWQSHNALAGKWWFSKPASFGGNCPQSSPCTIDEITALYPNAGVSKGQPLVAFKAGSGWSTVFKGNIDNFKINNDTYNFEPEPYAPTATPTRPSLSGTVIYDSIPTTLPANLPSIGYQATSTRALGDKVTFAGSDRHLDKVAVTLSSWACQSGSGATCTTTPGSTFTHPVTLSIYNVAGDGTVGSLIATKTQSFAIPYRPTADPTCDAATKWRDTKGTCSNGINHVVSFDASGIVVPNTVIYSVAFNTQSYGAVPTAANGPFNSLNVSLSTGPANVGTNVNQDEVFWDTTYPGYTAGLKADNGWSTDGNPAVIFTATTPDTTKPLVEVTSPTLTTFDSTDTDITVKATDNVALSKVVANIYKDNVLYKSTQASAGGATSFSHTIDLANIPNIGLLPVGTYSIKYNAVDVAGNTSSTKTFTFTVVDKVKPAATLVAPTVTATGSNSVAIQVNATDDRGLNRIVANIYQNGNLYKSTQVAVGGATSGTHSTTVTLPEGTYTIRYNASDVAGNVSSTGTFTFKVDQTVAKPTNLSWKGSGGESALNGVTNVQQGTLSWKAADPTDVDHYVYKFWTNIAGYQDNAANPWSDSFSYVVKTADGGNVPTNFSDKQGTYFFCVETVDAVGNNSGCSNVLSVTFDTNAPNAPSVSYSPSTPTNDTVIASLTFDESVAITSNGWAAVAGTDNKVFKKEYATNVTNEIVSFTDVAGNSNQTTVTINWIDTTAPVVSSQFFTSGAIIRGTAVFNVNDSNATVRVNGVVTTSNQVSGNGTYTVIATDDAGNVSNAFTFTINNAQSININPINLQTTTPLITGSALWVVNPASVGAIAAAIDGSPIAATIDDAGNWSILVNNPLANGPHTLTVNGVSFNFVTSVPAALLAPGFTSPAAAALGAGTTGDDTIQGNEAVEGTSTEKNLAAAVDTDSTDGTVLGMAWYWWLLILAALATLIWWIIASTRNRAAQN